VVDAHLPALLTIEHRAWWPYMFDNLSQQPIQKREPYRSLASLIDNAADPIDLLVHDEPEMRAVTHVLVLGPVSAHTDIPNHGLRLVAGNDEASLYAVVPDEISPAGPRSPLSVR
jgi:hypothetical protein